MEYLYFYCLYFLPFIFNKKLEELFLSGGVYRFAATLYITKFPLVIY